jgi:hypothetical protein
MQSMMDMAQNYYGVGGPPTANLRDINVDPMDLLAQLGPEQQYNLAPIDFTDLLAPYGQHIDDAFY